MNELLRGPYKVGSLRMNDGALPVLAPCDPDKYGSDQRRVALIDPTVEVKRGSGWSLTEEDDPEQMALVRLFCAAPTVYAHRGDIVVALNMMVNNAEGERLAMWIKVRDEVLQAFAGVAG